MIEEFRATAAAAQAGDETARIRIKVNALHDRQMIEELYEASAAGVRVDIVTRNICGLRPGVKDLSENIRVRSVLGRFLEHSRFFIFDRGEESRYFLGSADLLPRNLDHRIEVVTPVLSKAVQSELATVFDTLLADNTTAWELHGDGSWHRPARREGDEVRAAQADLMRRARSRRRVRAAA